jgi:hypothetical protein
LLFQKKLYALPHRPALIPYIQTEVTFHVEQFG